MKRVVAAALLSILALSCSKKADAPQAVQQQRPAAQAQQTPPQQAVLDPTALPPGHPPVSAAPQQAAQAQAPAPAGGTLTGKVVETMNSGGYTYLKLRTASGDVWAAVQQTSVNVGATASIAPQMTLDNFESKTLNRKFDHIIFGVAAAPGAPPAMQASAMPMASGAAQHMAAPADTGAIRVAKAEGASGRTIAEVWAQKDKLKDAPVAVRGKVVKFLPGIMGRNWLHLRDGSGSHDNGSDDITVTTADSAAVGDVIVVIGTVRLDKDFGAGYRYAVIVEEAKVSK
jgi:hypothetical protein